MFSLKHLCAPQRKLLLPCTCDSASKRGTVILKRRFPVRLHKIDEGPRKVKSADHVYDLIRNENREKKSSINVILTTYVEGLGKPGEIVPIRPFGGYEKYLLTGLAAYATPENIEKYSAIEQTDYVTFSSKFSYKALKHLAYRVVPVYFNDTHPWTLQKSHLRTAFRLNGYIVPETAIEMPSRVISGPEKHQDRKEFYVTVTISPSEIVKVRFRICLVGIYSEPQSEGSWFDICEPLFEEDRETLNSMPTAQQHPNYEKIRLRYNR